MTHVLVPIADGFEELEAITVIDLLRRAQINVSVAGLKSGPVRASRGTMVVPDCTLDQALKQEYDMIVLPGGQPGATNLEKDTRIKDILTKMKTKKSYTAAICAAPRILAVSGLLEGKSATCYPGTLKSEQFPNVHLTDEPVVIDDKVITSRGPGTAMDFALALIELLLGKTKRHEVETGLVRPK